MLSARNSLIHVGEPSVTSYALTSSKLERLEGVHHGKTAVREKRPPSFSPGFGLAGHVGILRRAPRRPIDRPHPPGHLTGHHLSWSPRGCPAPRQPHPRD